MEVTNCEIENLASEYENIPALSHAKALGKAKYYEKIVTEINDLIDMIDSDEMKVIELIDDFISELTDLLRNLREKYEVLEDIMSNEDYNNKPFKHDDTMAKVKQNIRNAKSAKIRVRELKKERIRMEEREKEERIRKEEEDKMNRIRKVKRNGEDRIRKEELEKGERLRKEKEEKEERIRHEKDEKEERI